MNIGITGATGFLGSYLLKELLKEDDYKIKALTRNPIKSNTDIEWQIGNLSSKYDCEEFIKNLDVIIHFAHNNNSPMISNNDVISDASLNLTPNLTLLESIKQSNKKIHFIYISSGGGVYGNSKNKTPFRETDACMPLSSYGIQKLTMENYLRLWASQEYIDVSVLRISNPYGILLPSNRKQGLIGVVLNKLKNNETIQVFGDPNNIRDYLHLDDMSKSIKAALINKCQFNIYNIGAGVGYSVDNILNIIENLSNKKMKREYIETKDAKNLTDWNVLDVSKAKAELNWSPQIKLKDGLQMLCNEVFN